MIQQHKERLRAQQARRIDAEDQARSREADEQHWRSGAKREANRRAADKETRIII